MALGDHTHNWLWLPVERNCRWRARVIVPLYFLQQAKGAPKACAGLGGSGGMSLQSGALAASGQKEELEQMLDPAAGGTQFPEVKVRPSSEGTEIRQWW